MRKILFLLVLVTSIAKAELPLSFTATPTINNMAIGQTQILNYTIRNNLPKTTLPLKSISVVNEGDRQQTTVTQTITTCGTVIFPQASCNITVILNNPQLGAVNRRLSIDYGGRAPLISPINILTTPAAYTILVYIVGADLESDPQSAAATNNINQMKQIGSTVNINIVIETGGADKIGWRTVKRKFIYKGGEFLLADFGSVNMGFQTTVQNFFIWGVRKYPAQKYIAIFWNHGGGPNGGFGGDEVHEDTTTPINELSAAMQNVFLQTGKTFEIIGFDTCLLGNVETFSGLYNYTNYLIGSEDLEPGLGWQYNTFLNFINTNPTANGLQIGKNIVNGFTEQNKGDVTTLAVVSSAAMPNLITTINQFSFALSPYVNSSVPNWKLVAQGRLRAPDYSTSVWERRSTDVADLKGLANGMSQAIPADVTLQNASTALSNAVSNAVKYVRNSDDRTASTGLTIYFPSILASYITSYPSKTILNGNSFFSTAYTNLVTNYHNFYLAQTNNLIAIPAGLAFDGTNYTATVSNDYEQLYASVGNDNCTNVFRNNGTMLPPGPCYRGLESEGIIAAPAGGNTWNISYNKASNAALWPLLNGEPALLITLDTEPVIPGEISFLIPVTRQSDGVKGYLNIVLNDEDEYEVRGFQRDASITNTLAKVANIPDGTRFFLGTLALDNGTWAIFRTNVEVTSPFTISFGTVPPSFNAFRFLVADLTGALNVTATSAAY